MIAVPEFEKMRFLNLLTIRIFWEKKTGRFLNFLGKILILSYALFILDCTT